MTDINFSTSKKKLFERTWERFTGLDSFTKGIIIAMLCILIATPVIISTRQQTKNFAAENHTPVNMEKSNRLVRVRNATDLLLAAGRALKDDPKRKNDVSMHIVPQVNARAKDLEQLAQDDPQAAAKMILPDDTLTALSSVPGLGVEKKVTLSGTLTVWHHDDFQNPHASTFQPQLVTQNGDRINLYTNGKIPRNVKPGDTVTLTGYQLDQNIFLPVRDPSETVPITDATNPSKVLGAVTGPINTAVIVANFSDSNTPIDMTKIKGAFEGNPGNDVESFFQEASFGKNSIVPSYFGPYTIPGPTSDCFNDLSQLKNMANTDINYLNYRRFIYVLNCNYGGSTGIGEVTISTPDGSVANADEIYIGYTNGQSEYRPEVYAHELGHDLGNWHAGFFECPNGQSFIPPTNLDETNCKSEDYGDRFDTMGGPNPPAMPQFNAYHKNNGGWLDPGNVQTVTTSGTYTVHPVEASSSGTILLSIPRANSGTSFLVEYRQPTGYDTYMGSCANCTITQGASVKLQYYLWGGGGGSETQAIDTTPGSIPTSGYWYDNDNLDGALLPGKTFTDPESGISIQTVSADSSGVTVNVTIPPQSCTHNAPTYAIANPNQSGTAGQTVNYTVTFTNNDSSGCPANTFKVVPNDLNLSGQGPVYGYYAPFHFIASPDFFKLNPGSSTTITVSVTSPSINPISTYSSSSGLGSSEIFIQSNQLGVQNTFLTNFSYTITAPSDTQAPTSPTTATATALGAKTVAVSWSPATDNVGVIGYKIIVNNASLYYVDGNTPTFTDHNAAPNTAYTYSIQAFDAHNNFSPAVNTSVTTPAQIDTQAPTSPYTLSATATDRAITLTWTPSKDNSQVAGYMISGVIGNPIYLPASATSYTYSNLATHLLQRLAVSAYDYDGNYSNFYDAQSYITATTAFTGTQTPQPPTMLYGTSGTANQLNLSWTPSANAVSYTIFRGFFPIATVTGTTYQDTAVLPSASYNYWVRANDSNGNVSVPSPRYTTPANFTGFTFGGPGLITAIVSSDTTPPTASLTAPSSNQTVSGQVSLSASATDNVSVSRVEFYVDGNYVATSPVAPYTYNWDTTNLPDGTHWLFARAYDPSGNWSSSSIVTVAVNNGGTPSPTVTTTSSPSLSPSLSPSPSPSPVPSLSPSPSPAPDTIKPTVSITSPLNGSVVKRNSAITIQASASDNVGVTKVIFSGNSISCPADTVTPYTCVWNIPAKPGVTYAITATAFDAAGNTGVTTSTVTAK